MKKKFGDRTEFEGGRMFYIPHLRVTPLHMSFLGVRTISHRVTLPRSLRGFGVARKDCSWRLTNQKMSQ